MSDELWEKMLPLIPQHKTNHPPGTHRKRVDNRAAMDAIFFVLRTGCQWNALNATGISSVKLSSVTPATWSENQKLT
ncbi:TPA: transposase [Klebsiella pneumoniae]|uniref:transposase n=1 Tax=Klebsiella pneumoniae TaxID=573 RepID=UPI0021A76C0A|nr:transposase [Klebsiella pneumoniae]MDR4713759.1 transposase [Klebsiella pneumoniae]